jgi:hypothetical protein
MTRSTPESPDHERSDHSAGVDNHHREIWSDALSSKPLDRPAVYYVENHNAAVGYAEAALDFEMLVVELLPRLGPFELGNWTGPVLHLVRQTVELRLKALFQIIAERDKSANERLLAKHDLLVLWKASRDWLCQNEFGVLNDIRLAATDSLIEAFHAVDPSGDLFRFAQSRQSRFGKRKSYDRVGVNFDIFQSAFMDTVALLQHWEAVLFRQHLSDEFGWVKDPYFDADSYPRNAAVDSGEGAV